MRDRSLIDSASKILPSNLFSGLLTDLYELTMAAGYIQKQFNARATFELFGVRLTVEGLLRRVRCVAIVTDADCSVDENKAQHILDNLHSTGARLIATQATLVLIAAQVLAKQSRAQC